ncbi:hypothetical protein B0H11DRAFT_2263414 [Mycena galericulata]|nr:hypothetical protein B0H11DRAFT_2263414 [Mycena galericulata]
MDAHVPPFEKFYVAMLFPTGCTKTAWVDVPLRMGVDNARSAQDLDLTWWISPGTGQNAGCIQPHMNSITITHWPFDDPMPLDRSYTVFSAPQLLNGQRPSDSGVHPENEIINRMVPGLTTPWRGNVLVVRSAPRRRSPDGVDDMTEKDIYQTKSIVRRVIWNFNTRCKIFAAPNLLTMLPSTEVFLSSETVASITAYCAWREFLSLSHVNRLGRRVSVSVFQQRLRARIVHVLLDKPRRYVENKEITDMFFDLTCATDSGIVGSIPLALMTLSAAEDTEVTINNLNLLVPEVFIREWLCFLNFEFGFNLSARDGRAPRAEFERHASSFYKLKRKNQVVTITVTRSANILSTLVASRATSQMNIILRGVAISLYPRLTIERQSIFGWPAESNPYWMLEFIVTRRPLAQWVALVQTWALGRECGVECPRAWRSLRDFKGVGYYHFETDINLIPWLTDDGMLFQLGSRCHNTLCKYKGNRNDHPFPMSFDGAADPLAHILPVPLYAELPPEIELQIAGSLQWDDQVRYAHAAVQPRRILQSLVALRVEKVLDTFIPQDLREELWSLLAVGRGGITGSASTWVTEVEPSWVPRNLNIVVGRGTGDAVGSFLRRLPNYVRDVETPPRIPAARPKTVASSFTACYAAKSQWTGRFWRFDIGNTSITLTEAGDSNVLRHLLESSHSSQVFLLTRNIVLSLYPVEFTARKTLFRAAGMANGGPNDYRDSRTRAAAMGFEPTGQAVESGACAGRCPGVLRRLRGGRGIGLFHWSGRSMDTFEAEAYRGFLEDDFAGVAWSWLTCRNLECETYGFPQDLRGHGRAPSTYDGNPKVGVLRKKKHAIMNCVPAFSKLFFGVLYATSCDKPMIVPIPLDHGIPTYRTLDDLRIYTWITATPPGPENLPMFWPPYDVTGAVVALNRLTWQVPIPNKGMTLIIFLSTTENFAPGNLALTPMEDGVRLVHGDVLLMIRENSRLVDMDENLAEYARATFQLWWNTQR